MATERYCCMGCGLYWASGARSNNCPHCADRYFCDNVDEDVPPKFSNVRIDCINGHSMSTDTGGDVKYCCICKSEDLKFATPGPYFKLKDWQLKKLEELGI